MNATIALMKAHRSIRKFSDREVHENTLKAIAAAAQCAATSHFVQAYTIIRVRDPEKRNAIANLAGPQVWVEKAPVFLVFCADLNRLESACQLHDTTMEEGWAASSSAVSATIRKRCATCWRSPIRYTRFSACAWATRPMIRPRNPGCPSRQCCSMIAIHKRTIRPCSMNTTGSPTITT